MSFFNLDGTIDAAHVERMRDRVRKLLGLSMLEKHMLAIDWDALNEHYGFHGGLCPALKKEP